MSIEIGRPWARPNPAAEIAGGFCTFVNKGHEPDRLVAAASPLATSIEIQGIKVVGDGIRMQPIEGGLRLPADTTITLKPRGYHLLLRGLKAPLAQGQRMPVTLTFEKAGERRIELVVEAEGMVGDDALMEG
ncbi:MAG TPA: copper chaperone PCu(A)C [Reyranella sp.]|nr:copper chaperone PCu(A)C [Reyranella sp.]